MATVSLPKIPKGKEFEEYISACFQLGGYYIERNIIEREIEEILELDIILTNYNTTAPEITLVEVKSGMWGFGDLFKVKGWMYYLNIPKGIFITNKQKSNIEFIREKASGLDINVLIMPNLSDYKNVLVTILPECEKKDTTDIDIAIWRFSNWIERRFLQRLVHKSKSNREMACYKALVDYYYQTSSGIFFTENIIKRVDKLYSIFRDSPHITAKTGHALVGENFEDDYETLPDKIYKDTFMNCEYNDIQISMFLEHRARLAILKSAVDYLLYKNAGVGRKTDDVIMKILGLEFNLIDSLPSSFRHGLEIINKHKYFHRYPVFWQWFMWVFGGFILKDYREKEYAVLAEKTGIPIEEIPHAFESYQILFPMNDGWFTDFSPNSETVVMKMFPVPFMGVGANYRRGLYLEANKQEFQDLQLTGRWTANDLIKSNNLAVEVLSK